GISAQPLPEPQDAATERQEGGSAHPREDRGGSSSTPSPPRSTTATSFASTARSWRIFGSKSSECRNHRRTCSGPVSKTQGAVEPPPEVPRYRRGGDLALACDLRTRQDQRVRDAAHSPVLARDPFE